MSNEHFRILLVDDELDQIETLSFILRKEGYAVKCCTSGEAALEELEAANYDLLITDFIMDGLTGMDLLMRTRKRFPETEFIMITGYGSIKDAVRAMQLGAFTYIIKGNPVEEILTEVEKLRSLKTIRRNSSQLLRENLPGGFMLETGNSEFREILRIAGKCAGTNCPVLILGESGVGKEVLARFIHQRSDRKNTVFLPINCHAIPENLLEAELFGYEKGAFTGAAESRIGKFEAAAGGTLFLDEIGELPLSAQVKLLRAIETKTIERIGSNREIALDFRLICATNRSLEKEIVKGGFREDLFYRIGTMTLTVPPLRERREDLRNLIDFFFRKNAQEQKKEIRRIEPEVYSFLESYSFPGNVRELKNITERLVVLSEDGVIIPDDLPPLRHEPAPSGGGSAGLSEFRRAQEAEYIRNVLERSGYGMTAAAEKLGITRRQLYNKMQEYGIEKPGR